MAGTFRFSFGPWNIHEGADPFGPAVRKSYTFRQKLPLFRRLGFEGIQFHDDDVVPEMNKISARQIVAEAKAVKSALDGFGLTPEFVAPRLWEDPRTVDGGYTANSASCRRYAIERTKRCIDIANALGTDRIVLWLAREGTYLREAKDSRLAVERIALAINAMLAYDPRIRILIEPKPNEPMDLAYVPTIGHAIGLAAMTSDPKRVGALIESAHAILAGLDPSDEMGYALAHGKLWSVHLNDQNGLKFDQDRSFGSVDLRRAFNQVRVLDENDYGRNGEWVGLDVKALRTQKRPAALKHLANSREFFLKLLAVSRRLDRKKLESLRQARDYEELDRYLLTRLMGR